MWHAMLTILVFMGWGLAWGTVLGALSGTLIVPYFGTVMATMWGAGMGLVMGAVTGVLAVISDALFRREKMNLQRYRRRLALVFGTLTAIGVTAMLIATTRGILWENTLYGSNIDGIGNGLYLALSLIAGIGWGWLGAAYTATRHVDANITLRNVFHPDRIDSPTVPLRLMAWAGTRWTTYIIGTIAGMIAHLYNASTWSPRLTHPPLYIAFEGSIIGFLFTLGDIFLLGLANGFLLLFINRLYVKEYAPHLTRDQYKLRVTILTFAFTLFAGFLVSAFLMAPVSAAIAALAARSYADWLYDDADKFKRKAKEDYDTVRLEAADFDDDVPAELVSGDARLPATSSLS